MTPSERSKVSHHHYCHHHYYPSLTAVLRGYAQEVEQQGGRHLRDTPSSFSGHSGAGKNIRHFNEELEF